MPPYRQPTKLLLASQALPAAGAFVATPKLFTGTFTQAAFLVKYTRGGAGGQPVFRLVWTDDNGVDWLDTMQASAPTIVQPVAHVDACIEEPLGPVPADGAALRYIVPALNVGAMPYVSLGIAESGDVGAPGTIEISVNLSGDG